MPELRTATEEIRAALTAAKTSLAHALDPARDEEARERAHASITEAEADAVAALLA